MQRLLEIVSLDEEHTIVLNVIRPIIFEMGMHPKANYVLIVVINSFPTALIESMIAPDVVKNLKTLSAD